MFHHTQDVLRLSALIAGLAIIYPLQADDKKTEAVSGNQAEHENRIEAVQQQKRKALTQQLALLETQLENLKAVYTPDHPNVKMAVIKIQKLQEATTHNRKVPPDRRQGHPQKLQDRIQHVRKAIEHLHAAGLHDLADRVGRQVRERIHQHEHERDHGRHEPSQHVIKQMRQAIENLEQRMRESKEIQRAVEDTHRNIDHLQREFELRIREIEQVIRHNVREAERFVETHSGEFEKALEQMERHIERRFRDVEERMYDLHVQIEHKDRGDEDDEDDHEDE